MVFEISQPDSLDLIQLEQVKIDRSDARSTRDKSSFALSGYESYPTGVGHYERVERSLAGVQDCEFLGDRDGGDGDDRQCPVQKVESSEQRAEGEELGDRRALEVLHNNNLVLRSA